MNVNHISKSYFLHRIASNAHKILNLFDLHIFRSKKKCFRCRSAKSYLYIQRWYRETQCVDRRSFYGYWPLLTSLGHTSTSRSRTMYLWMVWSFIYILKIFEKTSTYSEIFSVSDRPQTLEASKKSITILSFNYKQYHNIRTSDVFIAQNTFMNVVLQVMLTVRRFATQISLRPFWNSRITPSVTGELHPSIQQCPSALTRKRVTRASM